MQVAFNYSTNIKICHSIQTRDSTAADRDAGCTSMAILYPILQLDWIQRVFHAWDTRAKQLRLVVYVNACEDWTIHPSKVDPAVDRELFFQVTNWQPLMMHVSSIIYHVQHLIASMGKTKTNSHLSLPSRVNETTAQTNSSRRRLLIQNANAVRPSVPFHQFFNFVRALTCCRIHY